MAELSRVCRGQTCIYSAFPDLTSVDYLKTVKTWLDANPNEVITLLFTNPEGLSLTDVWAPAFVNSGIASLAYVPPHTPMKRTEWPTLGSLIDSGKRVVVFMDYGADGSVNYILSEFQMVRCPAFPFAVSRVLTHSAPDVGAAVRLDGRYLPVLNRPHQRVARDVRPHVPPQPLP